MIAGANGPYDVCKRFTGRDLNYCKEQVDVCRNQGSTQKPDNPYLLEFCDGRVIAWSTLKECTAYIPRMIKDNGSCPSEEVLNPDLVCADYRGEHREYCIEQAQKCADFKDQFSKVGPWTLTSELYSCRRGQFRFSSIVTCVERIHSMMKKDGVCPSRNKAVVPPPAPAAGGASQTKDAGAAPKPELPPASAPAPVTEKPLVKLRDNIKVLNPSNIASEASGTMFVVVVHSLSDDAVREELNKMKPPENPEFNGCVAVIDWQTQEGRETALKLGIRAPVPGRRYVKWYLDGKYNPESGFSGTKKILSAGGYGPEIPLAELSKLYGTKGDGFGIVYVTRENFNTQFAIGSGDALVIVGDPSDEAAVDVAIKSVSRLGELAAFGFAKRIVWIPTCGDEGRDVAEHLGARYVRGNITTYYAAEKEGTWWVLPYSVPVNLYSRKDAEQYVEKTMDNVLVVVGVKEGAGHGESETLKEAVIRAQLAGNLKVSGRNVDRIAFVLNENVPSVFGNNPDNTNEISDIVRKLSRVPQAYFYTSENLKQPVPVSFGSLPGNVTPKAIARTRPQVTVGLDRNVKELTRENFISAFNKKLHADVVIVHSLDDDKAREYLNKLAYEMAPTDIVTVIDWSKPGAMKLVEYLGIKLPVPGFRYSHWSLNGTIKNSGYFEGTSEYKVNENISAQELVELHWERPDGWGFVHIDEDNFAEYFNARLERAVVATGNPLDFLNSGALNQLAAEREFLPQDTPYFWIHSKGDGSQELLKKLGIEYNVVLNGVSLNVLRAAGKSSWRTAPYVPIVNVTDAAEARRFIHDSSERVLVISGRANGYGSIETHELKTSLLAQNISGQPIVIKGKKVDRVAFITDMSQVYAYATKGQQQEFSDLVRHVTSEVQAYVFDGKGDERKFEPVPLNLLNVRPAGRRSK